MTETPTPKLTSDQTEKIRSRASEKAHVTVMNLNQSQRKVTEEELRSMAHREATKQLVQYEYRSVFGHPEVSVPLYIEVFSRIVRENEMVVSPLEKDAIVEAQRQKRFDRTRPDSQLEPRLQLVAKAAALRYFLGEDVSTADVNNVNKREEKLSPEQVEAYQTFIATYLRVWRDYTPRKKWFGIF